MDIKNGLRKVCRFPDQLRFVQLYAVIPHRQPNCRFHPVSACIGGGMCFPRPTAEAFLRDAEHYISTLESNWVLMRKSACRLEFVVEQNTALSDNLHALDFFDLINLEQLLESMPLLPPLPPQTLSCIRQLGLWMCKELRELLEGFQKTGNVLTTWQSYQLELA